MANHLLESYPGINVRHVAGTIEVTPTADAKSPLVGFKTLLQLSHINGEKYGSGISIGAWLQNNQIDTQLLFPAFGSLDNRSVTLRGETAPDDVVTMAQEGVELLAGYRDLSLEEQELFASLAGGNEKVDDSRVAEPEIISNRLVATPGHCVAYGTFVVAKQILLEA